nr:MAG TPA: hypothetical protein [Caudoviricetes sp.]
MQIVMRWLYCLWSMLNLRQHWQQVHPSQFLRSVLPFVRRLIPPLSCLRQACAVCMSKRLTPAQRSFLVRVLSTCVLLAHLPAYCLLQTSLLTL